MRLPMAQSRRTGADAAAPVRVPGSKSVTNRALLLAAAAPGLSRLAGGLEAEDTRHMRGCLRALGLDLEERPGLWLLEGGMRPQARGVLHAGASGTTLRFLLPWLAVRAEGPVRFSGDPRLFERPLGGLVAALEALGARWEQGSDGGLLVPSPEAPDSFELEVDPSASSQFLSGLAMAAASLPGGGHLRWTARPPSVSYLELTRHWLAVFGCRSSLGDTGWEIPGRALGPRELAIPGDWSGAAAFLCAAAVTGLIVEAGPLDPSDPQGDRAILAILEGAGCHIHWTDSGCVAVRGPLARGLHADLELCPDLGPVLAATAALAPGPSVLTGLQTLPLKECDRLEASAELVRWLGGRVEVVGNHTLRIEPGPCPGERPPFDPRNDHRMAFAAAVGGARCGGELLDPGCVAKTLPTFWDDWQALLGVPR